MNQWVEWFEEKNIEERKEQLKRIFPDNRIRVKKAKLETILERKRQMKYESRKNICKKCFLAKPCIHDEKE